MCSIVYCNVTRVWKMGGLFIMENLQNYAWFVQAVQAVQAVKT